MQADHVFKFDENLSEYELANQGNVPNYDASISLINSSSIIFYKNHPTAERYPF